MKNKKIKENLWLLCLFVPLLIGGCGGQKGKEYQVYYKSADRYSLSAKSYVAENTQSNELVYELIGQMNRHQRSDDYEVIKPEYVGINECTVNDNTAYVYFASEYQRMDSVTEVMYRAAVVKTLTQIEGVDYVAFYLEDQPLCRRDGKPVGLMSGADFIDDSNGGLKNLQWMELKLYFANEKGDRLVPETISVACSKSVNVERLVVEQLINGPQTEGLVRTVPADLKVLSVSVRNGVCYVNLNAALTGTIVNASANVTIYSIVNSLCHLGTFSGVQILINGQSKAVFRDISLEKPFRANMDLVMQE